MKKKYCICIVLIVVSVIFANWHTLVLAYPIAAVVKYITTVFAISYTMKTILEVMHVPTIKNEIGRFFCMMLAILSLCCYSILTIDTFLFHALTWFPGILRYPLFNAYGILYLIFIIPGILWHLGSENSSLS